MTLVADPCVAVVDDEFPVVKALGRLLRLADWEVAAFDSGESFLASLAAQRPNCVILDVHMPRLSGFDVMSRLRAAHFEFPVIFITASDDPDVADRAQKAGACALLRKPFSNEALVNAVSAALRGDPRDVR